MTPTTPMTAAGGASRREVTSEAELAEILAADGPLAHRRIQGLDLREHAPALRTRADLHGLVVLGGTVPEDLAAHLRAAGALVFPTDPSVPVDPYRARLYRPEELYVGLTSGGYQATPDARAYAWSRDARLAHDVHVTMLRAIHDDSMGDALDEVLEGRSTVGVMGGHALARGTPAYAAAAALGVGLAGAGHTVLTGGGPGAMEAASLGAWLRDPNDLPEALAELAAEPRFAQDPTAWATVAMRLRNRLRARYFPQVDHDAAPRAIGIPTWFYGHEPPQVFCDGIAKYFSNALREDGLIRRCRAGVVVLPGAAGTVQEIFQAITPMFYAPQSATADQIPPLVLVGRQHWSIAVPVWRAIQAIAQERPMAHRIHLVDDVEDALAVLA